MRYIIGLLSLAFLASCGNTASNEIVTLAIELPDKVSADTVLDIVEPETVKIPLDSFFVEIDTNFHTKKLIIPGNLTSTILFTGNVDQVVAHDGRTAPAKKHHDMTAYMPIDGSSEHGWLYIGHETNYGDDVLGDGGGATMFEVKLENGEWNVECGYGICNMEYGVWNMEPGIWSMEYGVCSMQYAVCSMKMKYELWSM